MVINHNISALNAHRHFQGNTSKLDKNIESLSSGLRINKGADDAAGLAVSEKMRAQVRGFHQASRNIQDSISLIQTTEGFLQESGSVLQRMRELSVQSANGTYTRDDRSQINVEIDQMIKELNRVHEDAKFNTLRLLDGYTLGQNSFGVDPLGSVGSARNPNFNDGEGMGKNGLVIQSGPNTDERMFVNVEAFSTYALGLTDQPEATYGELNDVNNNNRVWRELSFYNSEPVNLDELLYLESAIAEPVNNVGITLLNPQEGNRVDITSSEKATETISALDVALNKVNRQRADLGGFQNRLEMAMRGVNMSAENIQAAESRIRDADMAREFVEFTKNQILAQSSSTMLAQANQLSQIIMRVIG